MFIKKICSIIAVLLILICSPNMIAAQDEIEMNCNSAVLIDANSGEILFSKQSDQPMPIASLTKIMTMLITMEKLDGQKISLSDSVKVSQRAADTGGSQLFLEEGEVRSVEELLYGIAVESGNDAAVALAEYLGGNYDAFIALMNEKANSLGLKNTLFSTPCGLTDENNYSSAADIAVMSRELLKHDDIFKYISTWNIEINIGKDNDIPRLLTNTNKLLSQTDVVDGIKTGYTQAAGHCVSATAQKGDLRLICVVLNGSDSASRFEDAKKMLYYGFDNFKAEYVVHSGDIVTQALVNNAENENVELTVKEDIYKLIKTSEELNVSSEIEIKKDIKAPLSKEEEVGKINYTIDGKVYTLSLYPCEDIEKCSFKSYYNRIKHLILP